MIEQRKVINGFSQPSEMNPHFETVMNALLADVTPDVHRGGGTVLVSTLKASTPEGRKQAEQLNKIVTRYLQAKSIRQNSKRILDVAENLLIGHGESYI